jgi:hypothetical protein
MGASATMARMGKHSGVAAEPEQRDHVLRRLLLLALGVTATLVAWGFLVWAAVDFGAQARGGESQAWVFLGLATIGATACLFVTMILGSKLIKTLKGEGPVPEPTAPGGRRAAR